MSELLEIVAAQAPTLRKRGEEIERLGRLPEDILAWIYDHRLFKLLIPEELGGRPTPLPEMLRIFDELSAADGTVGWLVQIGAGGGYFAPSFDAETVRELLGPRAAVIAGSGFPAGRARRVEGGYLVTGRWRYASGAPYATVFTASAVLEDDGSETIRAFAFTPDQVEVVEDWGAFGLKGTASHTMVVRDAFVPERRMFMVGDMRWPVTDPVAAALYRVPFDIFAVLAIASVSVGLARRFFELARELPRWESLGSRRRQADTVAEYRALFHLLGERVWSYAAAGQELPAAEKATILQTVQRLVAASVAAVQDAFAYMGMRVLWENEPINRVYRDLQTASHHVFLRPPEKPN